MHIRWSANMVQSEESVKLVEYGHGIDPTSKAFRVPCLNMSMGRSVESAGDEMITGYDTW